MRSSLVLVACCGSMPWSVALAPSSQNTRLPLTLRPDELRRGDETIGMSRASFLASSSLVMFGLPLEAKARNLPESNGVDTSKAGSLETLVPIVSLRKRLGTLQKDLQQRDSLESISTLLSLTKELRLPTDETRLNQLFDAYSDNVSYKQRFLDQNAFLVYYSKGFDGPGRASIESDLPVKQTQQYGARNEASVAWQAFLDEVGYLSSHPTEGSVEELDQMLTEVVVAVDDYLQLAPDEDRVKASKLIMAS